MDNGHDDSSDGIGKLVIGDAASADNRSANDADNGPGITVESRAGNREIDDGSSDLPLGNGGYKKRSRKRKIDGGGIVGASDGTLRIGDGRNGGSRSRTDADSRARSAETAEENASSGRGPTPREVTLDSLGAANKKEKPNTSLSTEFIAEGFGIAFHACAILLNDDEWKLPEEDASELAERTKRWIRTGTKNVAAFEKKLAKFEPLAMLLLGLFAVVLPRIISTRNKRNALRIQKETAANGSRTAAAPSVSSSNASDVAGNANGRNGDSGGNSQSGNARVVPFRRQDWREIPGVADS